MPERLCLACKEFWLDIGGLKDKCQLGYWKMKKDESGKDYQEYIRKAKECKDYEEVLE